MFFTVLRGLTDVGFTVVSVTTDGHRTNQSFHNSLGEDGCHPEYIKNPYSSDADARIYTMYDTVHLFKNMYFNLINKKTLLCPPFPDSESALHVQFSHLLQVYNMEYGTEAKMAYKLTDKALHPTNVERVNVQLAVSAMHETTIAALDFYGQREKHSAFKETAEFLRLVRRWFDIVNVKSAFVHVRLNDPNRKPVTREEKEGLDYLQKFGLVMRTWLERKEKGNKMSTDTLKGAIYTCRGLVGLANYLLDKHGDVLDYVLLGKVQYDKIEGRFGHLKKLAGGNYWASVRQFMEGEAVIRARSLVWLSGYSLGNVASEMNEARQQRQLDDDKIIKDLLQAASHVESEDLADGTEQAVVHLAGYLARSVLKVHKCEPCHSLLIDKEAPHESAEVRVDMDGVQEGADGPSQDLVGVLRSFTDLLNRGKLVCPLHMTVGLSKNICCVYRWLMKDEVTRYALFGCTNPKEAFQKVMITLGEEDDRLANLTCADGHIFLNKTFKTMSGALFNAFTSNYGKDVNSEVHKKRKSEGSGVTTRDVNKDKRQKLTGGKKQ